MRKHLHGIALLLLSALAMTACSGGDDETTGEVTPPKPEPPVTGTSWTIKLEAPVTRSLILSNDNNTLTPTWSTTDNIYVYYKGEYVGLMHPSENVDNAKNYVQLEGNLNTPAGGTYKTTASEAASTMSFYYQCNRGFSDYTGQNGTIATIASSYDYHKAEDITITAVDDVNRVVTVQSFNLVSQQAILRVAFDQPLQSGDVITITGAESTVSLTLGSALSANSPVFVALPLANTSATYTFKFTVKRNDTTILVGTMADKTLQNGKYYAATISLSNVLSIDIGQFEVATGDKDPFH